MSDVLWRSAVSAQPLPDGWAGDRRISRLATELTSCGLTLNEARIYIYLVLSGASPVRVICKDLGLHRVDVYRKLHQLEELGLLETYLDSPKRYAAMNPRDVASVLLRKQEERLANYKLKSRDVFLKLDALCGPAIDQKKNQLADRRAEGSYRFVTGRRRYYEELRKKIRSAEKEVLRIVSAGGLVRTFLSGLDQEYIHAKSRGVSLRMISEINSDNKSYAYRLARVVQLRHLNDVRLRFTLVDRSVCLLSARFDETSKSLNSPQDKYIVFEDSKLAEAFCFFFEHVWNDAKTIHQNR